MYFTKYEPLLYNISTVERAIWDKATVIFVYKVLTQRVSKTIIWFNLLGLNFEITGNSTSAGAVWFTLDGQKGTFCGTFDDNAADVMCRHLNYSGGHAVIAERDYSAKSSALHWHIGDLKCNGNETRVTQCQFRWILINDPQFEMPENCPSTCGQTIMYRRIAENPCYFGGVQHLTVHCDFKGVQYIHSSTYLLKLHNVSRVLYNVV